MSSRDHRSSRTSSSRRISTQRERDDDDEYDYRASRNHRSDPSPDIHHHHDHHDDRSSKKSSRVSRKRPPSPATAQKIETAIVSVRDFEDNSTISLNDNDENNGQKNEKWHNKTWVRTLLGFFIIVITVIITFFILKETGLGLEQSKNSASKLNADASNSPSAASSEPPSSAPTPVPFFTYAAPDEDSCDDKSFETGDTSFVNGENTREFDFTFDVTLSFADAGGLWLQELVSKINSALIPILVGCIDDDDDDDDDDDEDGRRRLSAEETGGQLRAPRSHPNLQNSSVSENRRRKLLDSDEMKYRYVIADATVIGTLTSGIACPELPGEAATQQDPRQGLPGICFRVAAYVDVLLRGEERVFSIVRLITTILSELSDPEQSEDEAIPMPKCTSLLDCMELTSPFQKIAVVGVNNRDPTNSPSTTPSQMPSSSPTTSMPSVSPSLSPTNRPSLIPSNSPTPQPSSGPTPAPTGLPSSEPTASQSPSFAPSDTPSISLAPTMSGQPSSSSPPSENPSQMPSCADFWETQDTDNQVIDPNDPPDTNCESEDENN